MKPGILILLAAGLASCARNSSTDDAYARKADAIFAKHGESVPQEVSSPVLIERALGEVSARISAAKEKKARIMFQGDRLAVVVVSSTLPGSDVRLDQSIQFFQWQRKWEMTWVQPPPKNKG